MTSDLSDFVVRSRKTWVLPTASACKTAQCPTFEALSVQWESDTSLVPQRKSYTGPESQKTAEAVNAHPSVA